MSYWEDNEKINKELLRVQKSGPITLYQYRSMEGFWKIIEGDSFWATNARFSNDTEEQKIGIDLINKRVINDENAQLHYADWIEDCYIICFSEKEDILSQWRGYAKDGGVSIGFDFSNIRPFYIVGEEVEKEKKKNSDSKTDKPAKELEVYNICGKVEYVSTEPNKGGDSIVQLTGLFEYGKIGRLEEWKQDAFRVLPFIKHIGFVEEREYRLAFRGKSLAPYVKYKDEGNIKCPYIVVKAGSSTPSTENVVRIMFDSSTENGKKWMKRIRKALSAKKWKDKTTIIECVGGTVGDKELCKGCLTNRRVSLLSENKEIKWSKCPANGTFEHVIDNAIYISNCQMQKALYERLHEMLHSYRDDEKNPIPKIWCEGHLPIRSITVGPNRDKAQIVESIKHYCQNKYWLRDVEIRESQIPYRS